MNNRFKFRIFIKNEPNPKYNGMFKVHSLHLGTNKVIISSQHGNVSVKLDSNKILMQSTGLKDKNGKLIYEGDIVKFNFDTDEIIAVVSWDDNEGQVGYYLNTTDYFKDKYVTDYDFYKNDYEVIGNIYENKELLESEG